MCECKKVSGHYLVQQVQLCKSASGLGVWTTAMAGGLLSSCWCGAVRAVLLAGLQQR